MKSTEFIVSLSPIAFFSFSAFFLILRYFVFAGVLFWLCNKLLRNYFSGRKIQKPYAATSQLRSEIWLSFQTIVLTAFMMLLIRFMNQSGGTLIYHDFYTYPVWYFVMSILLLIILHDTYFYWIHFAMHKLPFLMKFHAVHHRSKNPTPFTSFSFHWIESLIEIAFFPLIVLIMPVHPIALAVVGTLSIITNILGHSGYEFFFKGFLDRPILKWFNTSTHHNLHHQYSSGNFGLYFNFWDTLMGTNLNRYKESFDRLVDQKSK